MFARDLPLLSLSPALELPMQRGTRMDHTENEDGKIVVAQILFISRKNTESLTKRACYLFNPDTTVGC